MALFNDLNDGWLFESPMFSFVNPNDVCPQEIWPPEPTQQPPPKLQRVPLKIKSPIKTSGRKKTGRERQIELERQEAEQLRLRDHYRGLINELQSKCNKLRQILENIVATSPEYNSQVINFLENSELDSFKAPLLTKMGYQDTASSAETSSK